MELQRPLWVSVNSEAAEVNEVQLTLRCEEEYSADEELGIILAEV